MSYPGFSQPSAMGLCVVAAAAGIDSEMDTLRKLPLTGELMTGLELACRIGVLAAERVPAPATVAIKQDGLILLSHVP